MSTEAAADWLPPATKDQDLPFAADPPKSNGAPKRLPATIAASAVDGLKVYNAEIVQLPAVVSGLLYHGVTLFAGRPKVGKSWLTLQLAIDVALGRPLWGRFQVERPGRVLYCALEEPQVRTTARLRKLLSAAHPLLENIHFFYRSKPLLTGGVTDLDVYLTANPCELIVIDTLSAIVQANGKRDAFRSDYNEVAMLRQLAEKHKIASLVVTHLRKMGADSFIDAVAGTTGLTAACDAIWGLRRQSDGNFLLEITGREAEEQTYGLRFEQDADSFGWNLLGEGADLHLSAERREIVDLLRDEGPQEPKAIAKALSKNPSTTRVLLRKLAEEGRLVKVDGKYRTAAQK